MPPRLTDATCRVLVALSLARLRPSPSMYGLEIAREAGIQGGTLYPVLARMEQEGWVDGQWEELDESAAGRRRRRYYWLTADGMTPADRATERLNSRTPAWLRSAGAGTSQ